MTEEVDSSAGFFDTYWSRETNRMESAVHELRDVKKVTDWNISRIQEIFQSAQFTTKQKILYVANDINDNHA